MSYRVCVPTAGTGSRLGELTRYLNKSLNTVANKPILSHVIDQFPPDCEFVIALGHKGALVHEYLLMAYPHRVFHFAEVAKFEGPGSGLGLSLLCCEPFLQQPFVFCSCDTLIDEPVPPPEHNWAGFSEMDDLSPYRTLRVSDGKVIEICEKGISGDNLHAYIGLAAVFDHEPFWGSMKNGGDAAIAMGEAFGLRYLLGREIKAYKFTWHDCGNLEALEQTRNIRKHPDAPNVLNKPNEAIWFVNGHVIKFSRDEDFIRNRVSRAHHLAEYCPRVVGSSPHMYRYREVRGAILSRIVSGPLFEKLLNVCEEFWTRASLSSERLAVFKERCRRFYRDKTKERVDLFYRTFGKNDGIESINGRAMPPLGNLLDHVDWDWLAEGIPGRFHGDFHFENILYSPNENKFTFLDWRQEFGGDLETGDIYYDLAKLLHGLIICHELIGRNLFWIEWGDEQIQFDFHRKQILVECERLFFNWLSRQGYDASKVRVLTALVYLNIAALHHYPYSLLLYCLGKEMLFKSIPKS